MIIRGIFTNTKLSPTRMNSETTVPYIVANECPGLKRGDLVQLVGYDSKFQVVWTYASSREQESYETVTISEINGKQINTMGKNNMEQFGNMNVDNVFGDLTKDMYNEFMPQAEESARISITDALEKRDIKGCLITISDEPIHKTLPKEAITHYIGDECGEDLATSFIYRECAKKWDIYHIHVEHGGYSLEIISDSWKPYVGDNLIISDKGHVGESIACIVSNSYGQQTNS